MIEQIILNLAVNARDAMPDGGQIIIGTSMQEVDDSHLLKQPEARPGRHVCLSVKDTGCGIPDDILPRVFEPFFTTKEVGKGTGLGLATVYGNIKQHNGWVEVDSQVGHGTTIKVFLPGCGQAASSGDSSTIRRVSQGGPETILVVEDESALGKLIRTTLQRQGYKVETATTGAEALAVWAGRLNEIDLLVTDIVMPDGLSGWDLAREFQNIKPSLGVIYMSGYNTEMTNGKLASERDICLLEKPFSPRKLAHAVRDRLDNISQDSSLHCYLGESVTA